MVLGSRIAARREARGGSGSLHAPAQQQVTAYLDAGMTVALGTDGQGLTERSKFLDELRLAAYLQRIPSAVHPEYGQAF